MQTTTTLDTAAAALAADAIAQLREQFPDVDQSRLALVLAREVIAPPTDTTGGSREGVALGVLRPSR